MVEANSSLRQLSHEHKGGHIGRVFVAGGSGVVGRQPVPQLVARGHQVTATTTSNAKLVQLEALGADGMVMDGLAAASVREAVAAAQPELIVNEMTALSESHAGRPNLRRPERYFATTTGGAARGLITCSQRRKRRVCPN